MPHPIGSTRRRKLLRDLMLAQHDLGELADRHRLKPEELARWIDEPINRRCLSSLCLLADLQTQLLLSRYRLLAASRLIRLATDEETEKPDVARRACFDLLRLDLRPRGADLYAVPNPEDESDDEDGEARPFTLREALYGAASAGADRGDLVASTNEHTGSATACDGSK